MQMRMHATFITPCSFPGPSLGLLLGLFLGLALAAGSAQAAGKPESPPDAGTPGTGYAVPPLWKPFWNWDTPDSLAPAPAAMQFTSVPHIFFNFDRADLDVRARAILERTARHVRHHNTVRRLLLLGHTDEVADSDYNYRLAQRRVAAVRKYLVQRGVPATLIHSAALGEDDPIDEHWTREGRRRNRHVEIYLVEYPAPLSDHTGTLIGTLILPAPPPSNPLARPPTLP